MAEKNNSGRRDRLGFGSTYQRGDQRETQAGHGLAAVLGGTEMDGNAR